MYTTKLDAQEINRTYDLLQVVEGDTTLEKSGAWYIGPCPFCGGKDRFNLHKARDGWRWFCRRCGGGKYHTPIDYVMQREKLDFSEAITHMTGDEPTALSQREKRTKDIIEEMRVPSQLWRYAALNFCEECRQNLWKPIGEKARGWLHGRGFTDLTLVKYRVGFNPSDRFKTLEEWGLEGDGQVSIARGITLPAIGLGGIYYVKIRRAITPGSKEKKYVKIRGSKPGIFGWPNMRGAWLSVVTEGEFDCMILDQQAGDLAAVCTFGSATDSPLNVDPDLIRWHYTANHTGVVFDNDEQGRSGAMSFQDKLPNSVIMSLPSSTHDVNDYYLEGGDLADWVCRESERLGIVKEGESAF